MLDGLYPRLALLDDGGKARRRDVFVGSADRAARVGAVEDDAAVAGLDTNRNVGARMDADANKRDGLAECVCRDQLACRRRNAGISS
ncbi:MAG: hypothetical protein AcusKO_16470 [Acuticoccus sp.]